MSKKNAILLLADGAEEMEAVITVDVLRRAGIDVTIAGVNQSEIVECSRKVKICVDTHLEIVKDKEYDVVILPGGLAASKTFASSKEVGLFVSTHAAKNRVVAAICAAPIALKAHGIAFGKNITSYPSLKNELTNDYKYLEETVVTDGNIITSRGPATAYAFGLAIVEKLLNKNEALTVAKGLLYDDYK